VHRGNDQMVEMGTCATAKHRKSSDFCVVADTVISRLYGYDAFLPFASSFSVKNIKLKRN